MLKIEFIEAEVEQLYQQYMEHPSGLVKKKLDVIYLKSIGLPHYEIARIARIIGDRVTAYLKKYDEDGLARIGMLRTYCPVSALLPYQDQIKAHFQKHPPHTVSQAAHEIEKLVGIKLALSACRDFMRKRLSMKFRKMAVIPYKADPEKQEIFLHDCLEPLLAEEKQGERKVFFVDATHFVITAKFFKQASHWNSLTHKVLMDNGAANHAGFDNINRILMLAGLIRKQYSGL